MNASANALLRLLNRLLRPWSILENAIVIKLQTLHGDRKDSADGLDVSVAVGHDLVAQDAEVRDLRQRNAPISNEKLHRIAHLSKVPPHATGDQVVCNVQPMYPDHFASLGRKIKKPNDSNSVDTHVADAIARNPDVIKVSSGFKMHIGVTGIVAAGQVRRPAWIAGIF